MTVLPDYDHEWNTYFNGELQYHWKIKHDYDHSMVTQLMYITISCFCAINVLHCVTTDWTRRRLHKSVGELQSRTLDRDDAGIYIYIFYNCIHKIIYLSIVHLAIYLLISWFIFVGKIQLVFLKHRNSRRRSPPITAAKLWFCFELIGSRYFPIPIRWSPISGLPEITQLGGAKERVFWDGIQYQV
jgi:hypothetical protein